MEHTPGPFSALAKWVFALSFWLRSAGHAGHVVCRIAAGGTQSARGFQRLLGFVQLAQFNQHFARDGPAPTGVRLDTQYIATHFQDLQSLSDR
jgi:hypothetical protein